MAQNNIPTIGLLAFPDMQMLDFVGPFDAFIAAGYQTLILASRLDVLHVDERFMLNPDFDFATSPEIDVLVVPGGSGVTDVLRDDACFAFLKRVSLTARYVTSGPWVQLVDGRFYKIRWCEARARHLRMSLRDRKICTHLNRKTEKIGPLHATSADITVGSSCAV